MSPSKAMGRNVMNGSNKNKIQRADKKAVVQYYRMQAVSHRLDALL
ncbi:hypothetical protein PCH70_45270 [Pseudomonas cichorii JBC1]|nr:hypothetical protein PCH70_45270 [Pseudomonas cichorii JBC1]